MRVRMVVAAAAALAVWGAGSAQAQIDGGRAWEHAVTPFKDLPPWSPAYKPPRTADGKPDFQGVWSVASLTQLERGAGYGGGIKIDTLVIPAAQVDAYIKDAFYTKQYKEQAWTDPKVGAGDGKGGGDVRGYNAFWIDPGAEYAKINGEWRSSWITSTANGRIPWSADGRKARQARMAEFRAARNTGPEARTIGDRCLISYTGQAGPPFVNAMYNNHIQIVQTPRSVLMNVEMNHDARIIGINATARPEEMKLWFGDSVGRWEGDTLVVETRGVHPIQSRGGFVPLSAQGKVIERFTRKSEQEILYEFSVEDPTYYSETWKGEMLMRKSKEHLYEYACHEGNQALPGMLRGDAMGMDTAIDKEGE